MKINGKLEWTDYLNSQLLHLRPPTSARIVYYAMYAAVVFALVGVIYEWTIGQFESAISYMPPLIIIIVIVPLYRYVFLPIFYKNIFTQVKSLNSPFEYEFTETEMLLSNEFGNSRIPWENYTKWKENSELIMLYQSDIVYNIIPKRFFSDPQQIEIIKSLLETHHVPIAKTRSRSGWFIYYLIIVMVGTIIYLTFTSSISP